MFATRITIVYVVVVLLSACWVIGNPIIEPNPVAERDALVPRGKKGDKSNPKTAEVSIQGWEDISEEDCYQMLCIQKKVTYQRNKDKDKKRKHYTASGASKTPFKDKHNRDLRNAKIIDDQTISAEEWPPESVEEGGENAHLLPGTRGEQQAQGREFARTYNRGTGEDHINQGDFFNFQFQGNFAPGGFCEALFVHKLVPGSPEAERFCGKNGPTTRQNKRGTSYKMTDIDQQMVDRTHLGVFNYHGSYKRDETGMSNEARDGASVEAEKRQDADQWGDIFQEDDEIMGKSQDMGLEPFIIRFAPSDNHTHFEKA
ncbi:hypothetical protein JX266_002170 [Neoarthrinium moseri]|uniref:uncharacterized protein n=1 Tax=Neoarthrinium moseri TaxID=1658444 RepID=UPI001FDBAD8E|nr:uncharacterized protein JN550_011272 [Neoarthrinium moseri]KAI1852629.1 hypothetical protein JX266_002170 [Neoarthrinium moseri]KAI1860810.1 hypothetical protein JN550_011272 [Neoarthrinium moseri]